MKKYLLKAHRHIAVAVAVLFPYVLMAQKSAEQVLSTTQSQLKTIGTSLLNVISMVAGIVGLVMLIPNGYKYLKGDPSSNDALMKVGAGLLLIVILMQIIKATLLT